MEKLYYNIEQKTKNYSYIFWILSLLSWVFFSLLSFYSLHNIKSDKAGILFTIVKYPLFTWYSKSKQYTGGTIYPLQLHPYSFYIIVIFISSMGVFSFFIYFSLFIDRRKISIDNDILPSITKYNFIPLLLASFLFLIGEVYTFNGSRWERRNILGLFFVIIGLITFIFMYHNYYLNPCDNIKFIYIFQKITYSCIICLEWYYLCYIITNISVLYLPDDYYNTIVKILGIILPIIFGLGVIIFSFVFKDLISPILSTLILIGCIIYFFKIDRIYRNQYNGILDGAIYIIISILLIACEFFIIYNSYNYSKMPTKNKNLNIELRIMK